MKTFLKILLLISLLITLSLITLYSLYEDRIIEETRVCLSSEISQYFGKNIDIGSVHYIPFQSLSLNRVTFSNLENPDQIIAKASNITIGIDILSLLKNKQLKTIISVSNLRAGNALYNTTIQTISRETDVYKNVFNPSLINSVSIIDGHIRTQDFKLDEIFGILEIDNMCISAGKCCFLLNDKKYLTDFTKKDTEIPAYNLSTRTDNIGFKTLLSLNNNSLVINNLTGMFYTIHFDLEGEIQNFLSPEMIYVLNGTLETHLETFQELPGSAGLFARKHPVSGLLLSKFSFKTKELNINNCELTSTVSAKDLSIDRFQAEKITTKLSLINGKLNGFTTDSVIYDGKIDSEFKIDFSDKNFPYNLSIQIDNMDFGKLMADISNNEINTYGTQYTSLILSGNMKSLSSAKGAAKIEINEADLGPMPIITPLLGDIYFVLQKIFPNMKKVTITQGSADFTIENSQIVTDNLTFLGENVSILGEGYVDFNGNIDFVVQNQIIQNSNHKNGDWQTTLRNVIIQFGKFFGKKHLGGTLWKPQWSNGT